MGTKGLFLLIRIAKHADRLHKKKQNSCCQKRINQWKKKYEFTHSPQCPKPSQKVVNLPAGGHYSGHAAGLNLSLGVWFRDTTKGMQPKRRRLMRHYLSVGISFSLSCLIGHCFLLCPPLNSFQVHWYAFNLLRFLIVLILSLFCFIVSFFSSVLLSTFLTLPTSVSLPCYFFSLFFFGICSRAGGGWGLAVSSPDSSFLRRDSRLENASLMAVFAEGSVLISRHFPQCPLSSNCDS